MQGSGGQKKRRLVQLVLVVDYWRGIDAKQPHPVHVGRFRERHQEPHGHVHVPVVEWQSNTGWDEKGEVNKEGPEGKRRERGCYCAPRKGTWRCQQVLSD